LSFWGEGTYSPTGFLCYWGQARVPLTLDSLLVNVCLFFDVVCGWSSAGCLISIFCTLFSILIVLPCMLTVTQLLLQQNAHFYY
jgi:hypothetical protein